jgi:AraC family transcriptional regulator, L-rhamnose operon regulatory protein RhaS
MIAFVRFARENRTSMPRRSTNRRLQWDGSNPPLLRELEMLGYDHFTRAGELGEHTHARSIEICYIVSGTLDWWIGEKLYVVRGGDVFLTLPGERHGGLDAIMDVCELYWLQLRLKPRKNSPREWQRWMKRLSKLPERTFAGSDHVREEFARLVSEHARNDDDSVAGARAAMTSLVIEVLRCGERASDQRRISPAIARAMAWMHERLTEPLRITAMANIAGMHVGRFHERFRREVGQSPADWRTHAKMGRARQMLRQGEASVTHIALSLGYSSSQYFATAFRAATGVSPSAYRGGR